MTEPLIHSDSVGDPTRFLSLATLRAAYKAMPRPDRDVGSVCLIVQRGDGGVRTCLQRADVTLTSGIPGDAWGRKQRTSMNGQLTVMERGVGELVANGQPLTLFGDNLIVDLDLTAANLAVGTTLRMGSALLEVTPKPHNGCSKYQARFGADALKFSAAKATRALNLRGVYMRVTEPGTIAVGDAIRVVHRPSIAS